ncbi:MAG: heparinase II/III family protein [Oscillospiraceae bacterium]|nr:heparinase II/III family protein [Oscillospiraceae bacterium]
MKKTISILLTLTILLGLFLPAAALEAGEVKSTRTAKAATSGIWQKLDLSQLPTVQAAVNSGDDTLAREELLKHYTRKFAEMEPQPGSTTKGAMVYLACRNTFAFSEHYLNYADITATAYTKYTLNLVGNKTGNYVLSMLDKTAGEIVVASREDSAHAPRLVLICKDGSSKVLTPIADTYVRAGASASANYASSTALYAHDDYSGTTPYGNNTKRIYLRFDATQIPANADTVKLEIYAKRSGGTESCLRIHAFGAYATAWTETNLTWNWLLNNKCLAHFSWNHMPGGFNWVIPAGVPSQWAAYNSRFYEVTSLVQTALKEGKDSANYDTYMTTAKNFMLDFIRDAGAGKPATGQDLEPANRLLEFPYIYKHLLAGGFITPDENVTLLSWVWDETNFLSNNSYLFSSSNQPLSDLAYYHGFRHLTGFYQGGGFFSEFTAASKWKENYAARQERVVNALVLEDGAYNTISFGYPSEMINCGVVLLAAMKEAGDTATAYAVKTKLIKLAKYLVDCTQPSGSLPYWGQGAPSATKPVVQTVLNAIGDTMDGNPTVAELRSFIKSMESCNLESSARFDLSKIVVDRTGWKKGDTMLFMNAKCGGNHSHRDALALLLYYEGRQLLTDTGMTSYDSAHAHFNWQNSTTRSHNTIEVDGKAQTWYQNLEDVTHMGSIDMTAAPELTTITAWSDSNNNDTSTKSLSMDGVINNKVYHSTDFRHYRDVSFVKALGDMLIVTDKIVPGDTASHSYTQNWHCAPYSNASLSNDSYGTGTTAYSTGPNLIITQASSTTPTLRTGYDSTAATAPTKYFEYKQTKSGTVTYQTVLYPVSQGATASVTPTKLTMSGTSDATALAMSIRIADSSMPELKTLYHYHSFEATPSTRSFGGYTTDGSTAVLALNQEGKVFFAGITKGNVLKNENGVLLSSSLEVTDLTATLEGTTLRIDGTDPCLSFSEIQVNFSGQSVETVLRNGETVAFTQSSDGTVRLDGKYILSHFEEGDPFSLSGNWSTNLTTATVNTAQGLLTGTVNGHDPYVYTKAVPRYLIKTGDVVELRIKNSITSSPYTPLQLFYMTDSDSGFSSAKCIGHSASSYPTDEFVTIRLSFPASAAGQVLTALRIDMVGATKTNPAKGSYAVDYIYVGPGNTAPSCYEDRLFFDFTNNAEDRLRYTGKNYGDRNYDEGFWTVNTKRCSRPAFDGENLILEVAESTDNYNATGVAPFIQTSESSMALANIALDYSPKADDYVQIRFSMQNCHVASGSPAVRLYFNTDATGTMTDKVTRNLSVSDLSSGKFITVTIPFSEAAAYGTTQRLRGLRLNFPNVCSAKGKTGVITIDYIYVGGKTSLPRQIHTVTFQNYDGTVLATQKLTAGEDAVYTGATPIRGHDEDYHYSFAGWDMELTNVESDMTVTARFTASSHSFRYERTDAACHLASCSCGYNMTQAHCYEDGICPCGELEFLPPMLNESLTLYHSLNLASDIAVNFIVPASRLEGFDMDTVHVETRYYEYEGNNRAKEIIVQLEPVLKEGYYYFTLEGLTAVHMTNNLSSVLYGTKDGQEYYSPTDEYSITAYAYSRLNDTASGSSLRQLCAELLRYGASAQSYKGYRTDCLADMQMTQEQRAFLQDLNEVTFQNYNTIGTELASPTITWQGKSLDLNTKVTVLFMINVKNYGGNPEKLHLHVSYENCSGETVSLLLTEPRPYSGNESYYTFSMDSLLAAELRTVLTARVYEGSTPVSNSLTYSPDTYGNRKTGVLGALCRALVSYSDSAKAYFQG